MTPAVATGKENLRLRLQLPEGVRVNDAVPIHLERRAVIALSTADKGFAVERVVEPVLHQNLASNTNVSPAGRNPTVPDIIERTAGFERLGKWHGRPAHGRREAPQFIR